MVPNIVPMQMSMSSTLPNMNPVKVRHNLLISIVQFNAAIVPRNVSRIPSEINAKTMHVQIIVSEDNIF